MPKHIDDIPRFDDMDHEHEWLMQESAMRRERLHLDPARDDVRERHYRLLARALRERQQDNLPADFATRVAALTTATLASSARFELMLMIALAVVMVITAGGVIMIYGNEWMPSFIAILSMPRVPSSWLMAFASCLGASWLVERWQQREHR